MKFAWQDRKREDVTLNFLPYIPAAPDLKMLFAAAQPGFRSTCGESVKEGGLRGSKRQANFCKSRQRPTYTSPLREK